MNAGSFILNILILGVPFSVALLLAGLGETINQRGGDLQPGLRGHHGHGSLPGLPAALFPGRDRAGGDPPTLLESCWPSPSEPCWALCSPWS
ncbi:MAG: hypothetical protein M0C28_30400 [Candidatus Moduliflexus flocculans]|nr:hypothetical protein [Candidatus Moduliflexus flocculans]